MKTNTLNLEWLILVTDHYQKSRTFYHEILGLEVIREARGEEFTQFKLDNCYLAIYGRKQVEKLIGKKFVGKSGGAIYSFKEVKNIDKYYQTLKDKGLKFIKKPTIQPWGQRTAYFLDPDNNIWEIQEWIRLLN